MTCQTAAMRLISESMPDNLTPIQRILLLTDGTVTDILRAYFQEPIAVVRLSHDPVRHAEVNRALEIQTGTPVIQRHSLIQGGISKRGFILASSTLVPDRLPQTLREKIAQPELAIGQAIQSSRVETYREILDITQLGDDGQSLYGCHETEHQGVQYTLQRTYRIFIDKKPCIFICERFSDQLDGIAA